MTLKNHVVHNRGGTTSNLIFAVLALGLCGLCTFQFRREGQLRVVVENLSHTNVTVTGALEESRKESAHWKNEVTDLNAKLTTSDALLRSNTTRLASMVFKVREGSNSIVRLTESRDGFKARFEEQAEITRRASEATKKLKSEAEAEIKKIAAVAEERTTIANKYAQDYKELLETFEKFRAQVQAQPAK